MFTLHEKVILTYSPSGNSGNARARFKVNAEVIKVTKSGRVTVSYVSPRNISGKTEKAVFNPNGTQYGAISKSLNITKAEGK